MTDEQLQALLRSLPSVKAPTDLEKNLYISIAAGSNKVPHMLGTLPLVPAHEDFDTRLQQAIRERRHPVGPLPQAVSGGGVPWFASAGARWFTGAVVVVGLLFVTLNITQVDPRIQAPITPSAPAVVSTGGSASNVASRLRESVVTLSQASLSVEMPEPVVAELSGIVESQTQPQNVVTPSRPTSVEPVRNVAPRPDRATTQSPSSVVPTHTPATSANAASTQSGKKSLIDTQSAHAQSSTPAAVTQDSISKGKTDTLPTENGTVDTGGNDNSRTGPNM